MMGPIVSLQEECPASVIVVSSVSPDTPDATIPDTRKGQVLRLLLSLGNPRSPVSPGRKEPTEEERLRLERRERERVFNTRRDQEIEGEGTTNASQTIHKS